METWPALNARMRPIADLKPHPRNARKHSDDQIGRIAKGIETYGWTMAVLVDENDVILAGHGRVLAAQRLGLLEAPTVVAAGWSDEQKRAYMLADNRLAERASWDEALLQDELSDLLGSVIDPELTGFSTGEIAKILNDEEGSEISEIHTSPVADRFWISVRGPLASQAEMLEAIKAAAKPILNIEIDVGSVMIGE